MSARKDTKRRRRRERKVGNKENKKAAQRQERKSFKNNYHQHDLHFKVTNKPGFFASLCLVVFFVCFSHQLGRARSLVSRSCGWYGEWKATFALKNFHFDILTLLAFLTSALIHCFQLFLSLSCHRHLHSTSHALLPHFTQKFPPPIHVVVVSSRSLQALVSMLTVCLTSQFTLMIMNQNDEVEIKVPWLRFTRIHVWKMISWHSSAAGRMWLFFDVREMYYLMVTQASIS